MKTYCHSVRPALYGVLLVLCLLGSPPSVASGQVIRVACDNWPGYCSSEGGAYLDILKAIYEPHGYSVHLSILPFKRAIYELERGQSDLIPGLLKTPDRQKLFTFSSTRIDNAIVVDAYLSGRTQWNTPRVYTRLSGYQYGETQGKLIEAHTNQQAINLLQIGRADYFSTDLLEFANALEKMGIPITNYGYTIRSHDALYLAFNNSPRGKQLAALYDQEIRTLAQSGRLQEMLRPLLPKLLDAKSQHEYLHFPEIQ